MRRFVHARQITPVPPALARWRHQLGEKSDWTLQLYYDRFSQQITDGTYAFTIDTLDLEYQQRFPLTARQQIIYGLGYRLTSLDFTGSTNGSAAWSTRPFTESTGCG